MTEPKGGSLKKGLLILIVLAGIGAAIVYAVDASSGVAGKDAKTTTGRFIPGNVDTIGGLRVQAIYDSKLFAALGVRDVVSIDDLPLPPEFAKVLNEVQVTLPQVTSITLGGRSLTTRRGKQGEWIVVVKGDWDKAVIEEGLTEAIAEKPSRVEDLNVFTMALGKTFVSNRKEWVMGSPGLVDDGLKVYTGDVPAMDVKKDIGEVAAGVDKEAVLWIASKLDIPAKLPSLVVVDLAPFSKVTHGALSGDIKSEAVHLKLAMLVAKEDHTYPLRKTLDDMVGKLVTAMVFIPGTGPVKRFLRGLEFSNKGRRVVVTGTVKMHDIKQVLRGFRKLKSIF